MKNVSVIVCICAFAAGAVTLKAQEPVALSFPAAAATSVSSTNTRHGLFNWLDSRSAYGVGVFPEPFLVDDSDLEPNEFRLDWLHSRGPDQHSDYLWLTPAQLLARGDVHENTTAYFREKNPAGR